MTDERQARIDELVTQRAYSSALGPSAVQLGELLGFGLGRDDAVSAEAVRAALDAAQQQGKYHLLWHRVWGAMLRAEVIEATSRLADLLEGEQAVLVWGQRLHVGFVVPVAAVLRAFPEHIGPEPGKIGPGGIGSDVLLVGEEGKSGLLLAYNHLGNADEYELRSWGRYARSVSD